jgi:uncharacterized repeat protein (TIGR01451 family)
VASGSGNINTPVSLSPQGTAVFTITATIAPNATGTLTNVATATTPAGLLGTKPITFTATDTVNLTPTADLSVTKSDDTGGLLVDASVMTPVTYTVVVTNSGPSTATGATLTDALPPGIASFTWTTATSGGATVTTPSGSGSINDTMTLPVNATVTFTITATTSASASGPVVNTAVVAPPAGVIDPNPANNTAQDTITLENTADLRIGISDNTNGGLLAAGHSVTFTVTVSNFSAVNVAGIQVSDILPADFINASWQVTSLTGAGTSANPGNGTGGISSTVTLGGNGSVTFALTATLAASVPPGSFEVYFAQLTAPFYINVVNPNDTSDFVTITTT